MCGPEVPWDWLVLDVSFVLALVGGGLTFRAKGAAPITWILFGGLSIAVGGFLLAATWQANAAFAAASAAASTTSTAAANVAMLANC